MSFVRAKLAELGLEIPTAAKPIAAYVPAVRTGNLVFTAGQLPLVDGKISLTGKVGAVAMDPSVNQTIVQRALELRSGMPTQVN